MSAFADLLASNPLVLLALLVAAGSAIGAITFKRFALGPAAVLFLALAVSAQNLLDSRVNDFNGFPLPGRAAYATLSGRWDFAGDAATGATP